MIDLIKNVDTVLNYFVPGFILMYIYSRSLGKKLNDNTFYLVWCVVISTLQEKIISAIWVKQDIVINTIIACIVGYLVSKVRQLKIFIRLHHFLFGQTLNDDIWMDILDPKGTKMRIHKSGFVYEGDVHFVDEQEGSKWIAIRDYLIYENEKLIEKTVNPNIRSCLVYRLDNADYIEVYYKENSLFAPK